MIVLLGATGYVGKAFQRALARQGAPFIALSRSQLDYTRYSDLVRFLKEQHASFLINAAGYTGKPNVDACEADRADTLQGNVLLPLTISHACTVTKTPWGHVSSGCIYNGAIIADNGERHVERDLNSPHLRDLVARTPDALRGFSEADEATPDNPPVAGGEIDGYNVALACAQ